RLETTSFTNTVFCTRSVPALKVYSKGTSASRGLPSGIATGGCAPKKDVLKTHHSMIPLLFRPMPLLAFFISICFKIPHTNIHNLCLCRIPLTKAYGKCLLKKNLIHSPQKDSLPHPIAPWPAYPKSRYEGWLW